MSAPDLTMAHRVFRDRTQAKRSQFNYGNQDLNKLVSKCLQDTKNFANNENQSIDVEKIHIRSVNSRQMEYPESPKQSFLNDLETQSLRAKLKQKENQLSEYLAKLFYL